MSQIKSMPRSTYLAIRGDFILKVDGSRPILYPLDNNDTRVHFLTPTEGFILSLLSGRRSLAYLQKLYKAFFPENDPDDVVAVLDAMDTLVRRHQTGSGIGREGLFAHSSSPIESVQHFDPREFIISPDQFDKRLSDLKTRRRLETPISVLCVLTSRCTTNCAYCYADRRVTSELPLCRWRELIAEMKRLGIRLCALDNGDVFARRDGVKLCAALIENDMHFLLSTKSYVSADDVRALVTAGFTNKINGLLTRTVQLSIDAIDDNVQRRLYGVKPICERTARTLDNFLSYGINPRIKAVITGLNFDQTKALVRYYYSRGARQFHFVKYYRSFYKHVDELFLTTDQLEYFQQEYDAIQREYPDADCWQNVIPPRQPSLQLPRDRKLRWEQRKGCGGGWLSLGISSDGKAFLCEQMKMSEEFIVGDLRTQSIMEVWQSQRLKDFIFPPRSRFEGTICHSCPQFEQCMWEQGRCYRDAYFAYGTIYDSPPMCPHNARPGLRQDTSRIPSCHQNMQTVSHQLLKGHSGSM